jgi:hypothetical protein
MRDLLQRLRIDSWRSFNQINLEVTTHLLRKMETNGWIERRRVGGTVELKLTAGGLGALRAKIP